MALFITPNIPSVNAVSSPPALATRNPIWFLTPFPRALSAKAVGATTAGDTDARIDPKCKPAKYLYLYKKGLSHFNRIVQKLGSFFIR